MKNLLILSAVLLLAGCSGVRYNVTKPDGTRIDASVQVPFFYNGVLRGLAIDRNGKVPVGLALSSGSAEPNVESITASADALGSLIGAAAKSAAK